MTSDTQPAATPTWMLWTGWVLTLLPAALLTYSAVGKLMMPPEVEKGFKHLEWDGSLALGLGIIELACVVFYVIPRTSVFGAVLVTGYFGGAIATHGRIGDPPGNLIAPFVFGMVVWLGLYFRDHRVRALLPLYSPEGGSSWFVRIGFTIVSLAIGFVAVAALQPADFRVERKATIGASPAEVFAHVNDLRKWDAWSPWAKLDPDAKMTFEGPAEGAGASFTWVGNDKIGEGKMTVLESRPPEAIKLKIDFVKPMPDTGTIDFTFKADGAQTIVTWSMSGRKDLASKVACFFMDLDQMIGADFEKGLASMKSVVESGKK